MEEELRKQFTILYKILKSDDLSDSIAQMYWNIYTSLLSKGFTEEQALQIVVKFNLSSAK